MNRRAIQALKVLAVCFLVGGLTWSLSWGLQFLSAALTPSAEFHLASLEANRLAAVTALTTFVIMVVIDTVLEMDGCMVYIFGASISGLVVGLGGKIFTVFSGTAVSTVPAQIVYCIIAVLWSVLMWHVILDDQDNQKKNRKNTTPHTDK